MVICDVNKDKGFVLYWDIENFNFCWHKTGEYLESSLFTLDTSCKTSWRLWLYPRGEDDGEYISCYLFREDGGPEMVDMDFELCLYIEGEDVEVIPLVSFSKIYSFKSRQREGLKCFASRWQVFAPIAAQKDKFTLTVKCKILNLDKNPLNRMHQFISTVIATYSVSDIEQFDCDSSLDPEVSKDIEIKPILEDEPLLNLNVSYFEKYLVIKINPKNCGKIKYAVCKISVINHWLDESPIQHIRSWIGEIKTDIWKYYIPQAQSITLDGKYPKHNSFLLHYDFTFSTGDSVTNTKHPKFSVQECLNASLKAVHSARTALNALEDLYRTRSFVDFQIQTNTGNIPVHKAFVCTRVPILMNLLPMDLTYYQFRIRNRYIADKFVLFLYSDILENLAWNAAHNLYKLSAAFGVELLTKKYSTYFKDRLNIYSAIMTLFSSYKNKDLYLTNFVINYIINHADDIFGRNEWRQLLLLKPELGKKIMFLYYKKLNSVHWNSINTHLQ
ncbi:TD and POZ domain-containing protein 4 [Argiope bruennichi]|uniref:TD and POZ domain-containing protein 4 n=1 Tax=Argiope bruennichi TaxID=94029 RepID=A0A8T0ETK1_ARGBR|nr:TD and POZ domain-containing protein 4 [Argiope bruennichi]